MKLLAICLVTLTAILFSGCASVEKALNKLPQVSASEIHFVQGSLVNVITIDAVGLVNTPEQVKADLISIKTGNTSLILKDYVRVKQAE